MSRTTGRTRPRWVDIQMWEIAIQFSAVTGKQGEIAIQSERVFVIFTQASEAARA